MSTMSGTDIAFAAKMLKAGGLVAIPTETVYGLAANALDANAVLKIFEAKNRPQFDPLIVHVRDLAHAHRYASSFPALAEKLASTFWPGPLTLVLPKTDDIPDIVSSGLPTVGLRVPKHPLTQLLLAQIDFPLAAPSANPFGYVSPTSAAHVADQLGDAVAYILDGGSCTVGLESTIVSFDSELPRVLRLGGCSIEAIEACIGPVEVANHSSSNPQAPGMLTSHYATRKPLVHGDLQMLTQRYSDRTFAVIAFRDTMGFDGVALSPDGNLGEAAQHLFAAMRSLDAMDVDLIIAETMPNEGLGRAINDRLSRAASQGSH